MGMSSFHTVALLLVSCPSLGDRLIWANAAGRSFGSKSFRYGLVRTLAASFFERFLESIEGAPRASLAAWRAARLRRDAERLSRE
ncbi:MAG: hypothetical protein AAF411_26850 [Myxococcota bacterium]